LKINLAVPVNNRLVLNKNWLLFNQDLDSQRLVDFHPELVNFNQNLVTTQPMAGWCLGWNSTLLPAIEKEKFPSAKLIRFSLASA